MSGSLKNSSSVRSPNFQHQKLKMPGIEFHFNRKMRPSMESQPSILLLLVLNLSLSKLRVFLLYGFPKENYLCLLSLVIIVGHVILLDKILRSYCLNDKNLTWYQS